MKTPASRQQGFTLPEILVVLVLLGILISTLTVSFASAERELALTQNKDLLLNDMPAALLSFRARKGSLSTITKTEVTKVGFSTTTPFGDNWTLGTPTARSVQLTWLLTSAPEPAVFGEALADSLTNASGSAVSLATYTDSNKTLAVTYRMP